MLYPEQQEHGNKSAAVLYILGKENTWSDLGKHCGLH